MSLIITFKFITPRETEQKIYYKDIYFRNLKFYRIAGGESGLKRKNSGILTPHSGQKTNPSSISSLHSGHFIFPLGFLIFFAIDLP